MKLNIVNKGDKEHLAEYLIGVDTSEGCLLYENIHATVSIDNIIYGLGEYRQLLLSSDGEDGLLLQDGVEEDLAKCGVNYSKVVLLDAYSDTTSRLKDIKFAYNLESLSKLLPRNKHAFCKYAKSSHGVIGLDYENSFESKVVLYKASFEGLLNYDDQIVLLGTRYLGKNPVTKALKAAKHNVEVVDSNKSLRLTKKNV